MFQKAYFGLPGLFGSVPSPVGTSLESHFNQNGNVRHLYPLSKNALQSFLGPFHTQFVCVKTYVLQGFIASWSWLYKLGFPIKTLLKSFCFGNDLEWLGVQVIQVISLFGMTWMTSFIHGIHMAAYTKTPRVKNPGPKNVLFFCSVFCFRCFTHTCWIRANVLNQMLKTFFLGGQATHTITFKHIQIIYQL